MAIKAAPLPQELAVGRPAQATDALSMADGNRGVRAIGSENPGVRFVKVRRGAMTDLLDRGVLKKNL
jgi:hypothetical protein